MPRFLIARSRSNHCRVTSVLSKWRESTVAWVPSHSRKGLAAVGGSRSCSVACRCSGSPFTRSLAIEPPLAETRARIAATTAITSGVTSAISPVTTNRSLVAADFPCRASLVRAAALSTTPVVGPGAGADSASAAGAEDPALSSIPSFSCEDRSADPEREGAPACMKAQLLPASARRTTAAPHRVRIWVAAYHVTFSDTAVRGAFGGLG